MLGNPVPAESGAPLRGVTAPDAVPVAAAPRPPGPVRPVDSARLPRRGADLHEVEFTGDFWARLVSVNAAATLEHCLEWMERLGWLANFDRVAGGRTGGERPGWQFSDSEVYKLMEALAWEQARTGDPGTEETLRLLTDRIAAAQDDDGYLNTCFGHEGQPPRYSDMEMGHELYCTGHLLQAAVARLRTAGEGDELVAVARRAADHVCREFGAGGRETLCGHPEIELGLVEFGRATGERRYVETARLFLERRGRGLLKPLPLLATSYFQDDVPIREADDWRGHAVRALYLAAAAVDVAVEEADEELLAVLQRQWERTVERRTYLTGGMGSRHQDEGFGDDWELPADRAYCETCAGVASVMVSWRLFLATDDVRHVDLIERTLFNVVATSPRADGRAFFYANPLHQRVAGADVGQDAENPRAEGGVRAPWFDVSCCPTNLARTLASLATYTAAVEEGRVSLLQYVPGRLVVSLPGGGRFAATVATRYPRDGRVEIRVESVPEADLDLRLRVPRWAVGATLVRDGERPGAGPGGAEPATGQPATGQPASGQAATIEPGWVTVPRVRHGERLVLDLPVSPRLTWPDGRIDGVRGCVAVERGPLVFCAESTDLPQGLGMEDVLMDVSVPLRDAAAPVRLAPRDGEGPTVDAVIAAGVRRSRRSGPGDLPYSRSPGVSGVRPPEASEAAPEGVELRLVPYHAWAERGPATMRVFLPVAGR